MIIRRILLLCVAVLCPLIAAAENPQYAASKSEGKVKVFILAGQSNMEGRGFPEPLTWQVGQEKYRERYTHFIKDGDYDAYKEYAELVNKRPVATLRDLFALRDDVDAIDVEEVEPDTWLSPGDADRTLLLTEQVLGQRDGYALSLLQAEIDDEE